MQKKPKKVEHILDSALSIEVLGNHAPHDISKRNGTHILKIKVRSLTSLSITMVSTIVNIASEEVATY